MNETLIEYHPDARGVYDLLQEMHVERGASADWLKLNALHYKMSSLPVGAKYWRLVFRGETIGVCVFGVSRPLLKERHALFPLLKPGNDTQLSNIHRYQIINQDFRVVGRFVVDTMFRSAGVAYRFLNLACRMYNIKLLEIQSSMSKYSRFAQNAGFQMVKPIRSMHYEKGVKALRKYFAAHPADQEALMEEFKTLPPALQRKIERELKAFYYDASPLEKTGTRRHTSAHVVDNWDFRRTIGKIQGLCFASPLYGFYRNPDHVAEQRLAGVAVGAVAEATPTLPAQLPLLAFDLQPPEVALAVEHLDDVPGWRELRENLTSEPGQPIAHVDVEFTHAEVEEYQRHDEQGDDVEGDLEHA